jgi:VWFA-related protein
MHMRAARFGVAVGLGAALLAEGPGRAQEPVPQVFRSTAEFVYLDVYARRDGALVEGLRPEHFQIFEDGTPQKIATFEFIRHETNPPVEDRRDPTSFADAERQAADPRNRLFVVYLDVFNTDFVDSRAASSPLLEFLTRTIGRNDLFAVMTPESTVGQLTFARRTDTLESELSRHLFWGEKGHRTTIPRNELEAQLLYCDSPTAIPSRQPAEERTLGGILLGLHRQDLVMTSLENLIVRLRGTEECALHFERLGPDG